MSRLLTKLREDAISVVEAELPTLEELRPLVGALIKHLEAELGAPDPEPGTATDVASPGEPVAPPSTDPTAPAPAAPPPGGASSEPLSPAEEEQLVALLARAEATAHPTHAEPGA